MKNLKNEILDYFDGIKGLASSLEISVCAIYQWKKIPNGRAYQIEVLSNGKFKAQEIANVSFFRFKKNYSI
jgi:hypothetical protein